MSVLPTEASREASEVEGPPSIASEPPSTAGDGGPSAPLADARSGRDDKLWALFDRYVALVGATLRQIDVDRYELAVPGDDRAAFGGREIITLAFSVEAVQTDPNAEMVIVGSPIVDQLVSAIRRRGSRRVFGLVPSTVPPSPEEARVAVPIENGSAGIPDTRETQHLVGRLTARVTVRAGATVVEHLVESSLFDLATGVRLPSDVAAACSDATAEARLEAADAALPARPATELVSLMLDDLREQLAPEIEARRAESDRALALELTRIDRYYTTLLEDAGQKSEIPDAATRRVVEAEHERRRQEEMGRHEVRAMVHPVQLAEWAVPVQRADWPLTSEDGHCATLTAQRALVGGGSWILACPTCGASSPASFFVCRADHVGCASCATRCSVCTTGFCRDHGLVSCHVDRAPACSEHARTCRSCRRQHCSTHEGQCADGDHPACTTCLAACAHCRRVVCNAHATPTNAQSALGVRRLCAECVRHCEGGTGEVVGPDEVTRCTSCDRVVCTRHQVTCAVDGNVHCSSHMRRADRSRRLVCEHDRAACVHEPNAIFARDEVWPCVTCGSLGCGEHTALCVEDRARHCTTHLKPLKDRPGALACEAHRTVCHVDGVAFSLTGTMECPICTKRACASHRKECMCCGRAVCTSDLSGGEHLCRTCRQLAEVSDPDDLLLAAAIAALGDSARGKTWRVARDATHRVVELDLGWTRRVVFAVRHGSERPEVVMRHSLLGSKRERG
jgi:hypothetical protein